MGKKGQAERLHRLIQDGDISGLKGYLRAEGANVKDVCKVEVQGNGSALDCAATSGSVEAVRLILGVGVDVNMRRAGGDIEGGMTALHQAVLCGHIPVIRFLLAEGANANVPNSDGQTALHVACRQDDLQAVQLLVENGAMVNAQDNRGQSSLQTSILRDAGEVSRFLIENDADIHKVDKDGQSPLHYAAEWESLETVVLLLAKGSKVNAQDNDGNTALHVTNDPDVCEILVEHGGDLSLRNKLGKPAREQRLDMEKEEYRDINNALSKHTTKIQHRKTHSAQLQHSPVHRIFSPGPPIPEVELKTARSNMLRELQKRTGFTSGTTGNSEKSPQTTPRSTTLAPSPLARDTNWAVEDMNSQIAKATI